MSTSFGGGRRRADGSASSWSAAADDTRCGDVRSSDLMPLDATSQERFWPGQEGPSTLQFEFSLRYELDEHDALLTFAMHRLERAGCADTLLGADIKGQMELQFVREAVSAEQALVSATEAVKKAFPSARLVKIIPAPDTPTASR